MGNKKVMEYELSAGLLPSNKNIYILESGGKELVINSGVTLSAIDADGKKHNIGCTLSADWFFRLVTEAIDKSHKGRFENLLGKSWETGSEFSLEELIKSDEKAWEEFINKK